jgi:uracil phosphoribosyltransferase
MQFKLTDQHSIANLFLAEIRDSSIQKDSMRFRRNMERIGEIFAYEISKTLSYQSQEIETSLGVAESELPTDRVVLATIMRAGLAMHQGFLNFFDQAGSAFISAYRRHHKDGSFEIKLDYASCPNLEGCVLIISDPMIATGASMDLAIKELTKFGTPAQIHIATAIASTSGLEHIRRLHPKAKVWVGDVDEELTAKAYIVPGLGDAGDLAYGEKMQD